MILVSYRKITGFSYFLGNLKSDFMKILWNTFFTTNHQIEEEQNGLNVDCIFQLCDEKTTILSLAL